MLKEYRSIAEIAGPLMLVQDVEGVTYNELGEIELSSGEIRRCKVLEIDGKNAVVQLFESAVGINLSDSKVRFFGRGMPLHCSPRNTPTNSSSYCITALLKILDTPSMGFLPIIGLFEYRQTGAPV
jgi:hypothetical protein